MVFFADIAFALELIALGLGAFLLIKVATLEAGKLRAVVKIIAFIIIIGAVLTFACTLTNSVKQYRAKPNAAMGQQDNPMMRRYRQMMQEKNMPHPGQMMNQRKGMEPKEEKSELPPLPEENEAKESDQTQ